MAKRNTKRHERKSRRTSKIVACVLVGSFLLWFLLPYVRGSRVGINRDQAFLIEFGRGSGWHGLNTVKILDDGTVILYRQTRTGWETAQTSLSPESVARVLDDVEKNGLLELKRAYHEDIADGTQWVLRLKQGATEKAVYFNNSFPSEITHFATDLDNVLAENAPDMTWHRVAYLGERKHERELWESIKP